MGLLTRTQVLESGLIRDIVPVPEWGGELLIQELNGPRRDEFDTIAFMKAQAQKEIMEAELRGDVPEGAGTVKNGEFIPADSGKNLLRTSFAQVNLRAKLVQLSAIDEEGNLIFTDDDVKEFGEKSGKALSRVSDRAQKISGLFQKLDDEAKN